ncbi:transposase [bacterium]|nr:transposase [bacterium]
MGLRFPEQLYGSCFFVTTTFRNHKPYGDIPGVYDALCHSLEFYNDKYDARLIAYVFMPTHIHLVLAMSGRVLSSYMRDFKKFTAQKAMRDSGIQDREVWEERFDRVAIYSDDVLRTKIRYIHMNPVRAGLAKSAVEWRWSSAAAYERDSVGSLPVWTGWA